MKYYLLILFCLSYSIGLAQLSEDFSDGDFTSNPTWQGSNSGRDFEISDQRLRSNSSTAGSSFYLSTENSLAMSATWEFWVKLQFNTSNANYIDVYLISDQADLQSPSIQGYFVRIGNTDDEISLYKRAGIAASAVKIIDGSDNTVKSSNSIIKVRICRDENGLFSLERQIVNSDTAYYTEGSITDLSYTTSSHFGIYIQQSTASFHKKHFFDDLHIKAIEIDSIPPQLVSASSVDSNTVEISFNEPMDTVSATDTNNFSLNDSLHKPDSVLISSDPSKFLLKFTQNLSTGLYQITANNVKDLQGNVISEHNTVTFNYTSPYRAKRGDLIINEIFPDPSPAIQLPDAEFVELFNKSGENTSLKGWILADRTTQATIGDVNMAPGTFLILCARSDTSDFISYGNLNGISPWPALNNAGEMIRLLSPDSLVIDSLDYSDLWYRSFVKKQGGWSLERIDPESICGGLFNWSASIDTSGGTPGKQNSIHISGYDLLTLKADSLKQTSDSTLQLYFNKHLDRSTVLTENFILNPVLTPAKIIADLDFKIITLNYSQLFKDDTEYTLSLSSLSDCSGKTPAADTLLRFRTPKRSTPPPPPPERIDTARIFITEIFADPSPEVGLPLVEFIEIFNPGKDTVDLDKWYIHDPATKAVIRNRKIVPKEYLILCPAADTLQYQRFGKTIPINPWPALNNNADQIVLNSFKGRTVDSLDYSDSWYRSFVKKQGGWSLERIDPESICGGLFNWSASIDTSGGTPGKQNSIHISGYDLLTLKADSLKQTSDSTLQLYFNKHLDRSTVLTENFILNPVLTPAKIIADLDFKIITLNYSQLFKDDTEYTLSLSSLSDCSGKTPAADTLLRFRTPKRSTPPPPPPERIDTARIFITEIFADPSPEVGLPLVEFIEIFNPGKDTVDLDKWYIHDPATKAVIRNRKIVPKEYLILCPAADTLQYQRFGKTIPINPWPALNNNADQIVLNSFKGRTVDSLDYSDSWYKDDLKKNGGYSLEMIDIESICTGSQNWQASTDSTGGTPGRQNSVYGIPSINESLKLSNAILSDSISLLLSFNKSIERTSALNPENYILNNNMGSPASVSVGDNGFNNLILKYANPLPRGINYKISVKNLRDCKGGEIDPDFNYKEFILTPKIKKGNLLISEILFNPRAGGSDFVEIYNDTDQALDLSELSLASALKDSPRALSKKQLLIMAGQYLAVSDNTDYIRNEYSSGGVENFLQLPSLPAFNDDKGTVLLISKGDTIDRFDYTEKMHFALLKQFEGVSLERNSFSRDANERGNFSSATAASGYATPGLKNSRHAEIPDSNESFSLVSPTFSPDNDGFEDLLVLYYQFPNAGMIANISIYNNNGLLVKKISKNYTLDSNGVLTWDGLNELNSMSAIGIYIVYAEIFDLNGKLIRYRAPFVLAKKF